MTETPYAPRPRASSLELLRVVAMLAVIAEHLITQSPLADAPDAAHRWINVFMGSGARIAVDVFVIAGAWFLSQSEFRAERLLRLYFTAAFYCVPLTLAAAACGAAGGARNVAQGLLPFLGRPVWFVSAYLSLLALTPFLNLAFALPPRRQRALAAILAVCFALASTVPSTYALDYVADMAWFCALYLLTGWIRRAGVLDRARRTGLLLAAAGAVYAALCAAKALPAGAGLAVYWLDNVRALPAAFCAFALFAFFRARDFGTVRAINALARPALAVYVIHQVPAFRAVLWRAVLAAVPVEGAPPALYAAGIAGATLLVYAAAAGADALRIRFVEPHVMRSRAFRGLARRIDAFCAA